MVTLHAYILRELLKTLGLTLVALTALFTMGGGLYNVIRYEGVSAADVLSFIPLLLPIVLTLTLPIAALFAATMVYGRLAADNELVACRAAGINIHRLFASTVLLSAFVALFMLLMGNFVIPRFIGQISDFARTNLRDLVAQHLQREGFINYRQKSSGAEFTLTADRVQRASDAALRTAGFEIGPGLHYLVITDPTFLNIDTQGKLIRFAAARFGVCQFDTRTTPVKVTLEVSEARLFEPGRDQVYVGQQAIGPLAVPTEAPPQLSWADLRDLLRWRAALWDAPKLRGAVQEFLGTLTVQRFYTYCAAQLKDGGELTLLDERARPHRIQCDAVRLDHKGLTLTGGRVAVYPKDQGLPTRYEAEQIELKAKPLPSGECLIEFNLVRTPAHDVLEYDPRGGRYGEPRRKPTLSLDGLELPREVVAEAGQYTTPQLLDPAVPLAGPDSETLNDKRLSLQKAMAILGRQITANIHFRLGYVASALVTVLMGAALGVIFRGSRALAAFALAMIPLFGVMILLVLGRQLSEDVRATEIGLLVTWGGLSAVLLADLLILRIGVRR